MKFFRSLFRKQMTEFERVEYCAKFAADCQYWLGLTYLDGKIGARINRQSPCFNVPKDETKGLELIQRAADQGAALASDLLFNLYIGKKDFVQGIRWKQRAAEQGLANAQAQLGIIYSTDTIVPQDDVKACAWLTVAFANGVEKDDQLYDRVRSRLSPEQRSDTERLIVELLRTLPRISLREHAEFVGLM